MVRQFRLIGWHCKRHRQSPSLASGAIGSPAEATKSNPHARQPILQSTARTRSVGSETRMSPRSRTDAWTCLSVPTIASRYLSHIIETM